MTTIIVVILIGALILSFLALFYCLFQLLRNEAVYRIRIHWIDEDDSRHDKYSYDEMFSANKSNWFGLRWPCDKHFK